MKFNIIFKTVFIINIFFMQVLFAQIEYYGVNLAGAEFGESNLPGIYNTHYTYPTHNEVDYFTGKGMNIFRVPFRWERMQYSAYDSLNSDELARMDNFVNYATENGAHVILDPHNYARYYDDIIGSANLEVEAFQDFWSRLAEHYKDNSKVIFGLMNEPHDMSSELWRDDANAAIRAIRRAGAENLILVPGNAWTGAHSWSQNWYGTPNATVMLQITDSLNNYAFEVHQYLDSNSSGTSSTCVDTTIGSNRLKSFTSWARTHGKRAFLGEFGAADNNTCSNAVGDMLNYMHENSDVWLGWCWWAAGPWWGNYMYSIEPEGNTDKPQMAILTDGIAKITKIDPSVNSPGNFYLAQNYPNPFNPSTTIIYQLAKNSKVRLIIYDVLGQKIKTLIDQKQSAGKYEVSFKASGLASGIYYYRLTAGNFTQLRKMIFIR